MVETEPILHKLVHSQMESEKDAPPSDVNLSLSAHNLPEAMSLAPHPGPE